jgi:hypothetical protein
MPCSGGLAHGPQGKSSFTRVNAAAELVEHQTRQTVDFRRDVTWLALLATTEPGRMDAGSV